MIDGERASLQWGGRFSAAPDPTLLAFGSSLDEDLVLARFDVRTSLAHVVALESTGLVAREAIVALRDALSQVAAEIDAGSFEGFARAGGFEDVHGAIDARVRALAGDAGESLHAGRSRNDQVATTLALYVRERATELGVNACRVASVLLERANLTIAAKTLVPATTHWQPAQPVLLAFWLHAAAQPFVRAAHRFANVATDARAACPLGSAAVAGSTLPLDRRAAAHFLGFTAPSANALDTAGDRDLALDLAHAAVRALIAASRISEEFVIWSTPAFGYVRLDDAAATGSSLMPQKKNPDPFELIRAAAAAAVGTFAGALGTTSGIALSYHRDLQTTKSLVIRIVESARNALVAFELAFHHAAFNEDRMTATAGNGYTVATDIADALIAAGVSARDAHRMVGERVRQAEAEARPLDETDLAALAGAAGLESLSAPLRAWDSVSAKRTLGSTQPAALAAAIDAAFDAVEAVREGLQR